MNNFGNRKFTESLVQNLCPGRGIAFRDERLLFGGATVSSVYQVSTRYCCGFVCICTLSHHIKCIYCCGLRFKNMERKESLITVAPSEFYLRWIDRKKRPISLFRSSESKKETEKTK